MAKRGFSESEKAEIIRLYLTPNPDGTWNGTTSIAERFGKHAGSIRNVLVSAGVEIRSSKESHAHGKQCKPWTNLPPKGSKPPLCRCGCGKSTKWNRAKNRWLAYYPGHFHKDQPYKNADWLRAEYLEKGRSGADIASQFGLCNSAIYRYLKFAGITIRPPSQSRTGLFVGPKNPAWKGGVTPERQRLYRSPIWRELVKAVFTRDNYTCQRCGRPKRKTGVQSIHAHHIRPWAKDKALRFELSNLVTLCRDCHLWVHSLENTDHEFLD